MALDLSGMRRIVEKLLDDELQLWRERAGVTGDELDEVTGQLEPSGAAPVLLWEGSGAIVRSGQLSVVPSLDAVVAAQSASTAYQGLLPLTAPSAAVDDVLSVARSVRDPQLVGRRFRVTDIGVGTYVVVRFLRLESAE
ncbi:DUF6093 family protein [Streptomyces sp. NPDC050549]|uniref:DUF6093 family protein n=1 Tax=Streptomyces sp. NPDC050549 TaxID=3155406 RepID=UPI003416B224